MTPDVKWDVVIGDNLQRIHERFEIDIPAVLIDRETGRARRVAIEVDSARTHSSIEVRDRDARKDSSLKRAGRQVVRVNGTVSERNPRLPKRSRISRSLSRGLPEKIRLRDFPRGAIHDCGHDRLTAPDSSGG